ncbi:MAG TPA: DUF1385 domain-containing protein [Armatimonadota bacterium]|nr:DUF1385 domain-containing protein [Armatimonadota bacterium]
MPFHNIRNKWFKPEPIGTLALCAAQLTKPITPVTPQETIEKVIHQFQTLMLPALPVVAHGIFVGWVTETRVAECLAESIPPSSSLEECESIDVLPTMITPGMSLSDTLTTFQESGQVVLPVVFGGIYQGCVLLADVLAAQTGRLAPPRIGGMATPLGVYLTTGRVSGGAGSLGLMLTGVVMSFMLWLVQVFFSMIFLVLYHQTKEPLLANLYHAVRQETVHASANGQLMIFMLATGLLMGGFLLVLRFFPRMSGFHAAEHQTVHAIEQGEPLTPDIVGKMPRVHPRCGTNLWGFMSLTYLAVAVLSMVLSTKIGRMNIDVVVGFAFWCIVIIALGWKSFGGWIQQYFTTRPATRKELESGIRAGKEVLQRHLANPVQTLRPAQRIWSMGLVQVILGAMIMGFILQLVQSPLDDLVQYLVK